MYNTVRSWIARYIAAFILPLFIVIFILFSYMISGLSSRSVELTQKTMQLYISQLEESMRNMERILSVLYDSNIDLSYLCVSVDDNQMYMSKIAFANYLNREILVCDRFDGMFVVVKREQEDIYIDAGSRGNNLVKAEILNMIDEKDGLQESFLRSWNIVQVDGQYFMLRLVRNGNNYCGAWICLNEIAIYMKVACDISEAQVVVTDRQGAVLSSTVEETEWLLQDYNEGAVFVSDGQKQEQAVATAEMSNGILSFYLFVPVNILLKDVGILRIVFVVAAMFVGFLLVVFWQKMQKKIIMSCVELSNAMDKIETEYILKADPRELMEFKQMRQGFNRMKSQIHTLKIQSYEQRLKEQKIHMQYLFGQIQPHFFLNTLNVLYSFAEIERYDLIQQMVLTLVKYFRYIFNNGSKPVELKEELSHVEDFIAIQQLRYPDKIVFHKNIESGTEEMGILPCLLQTFVENSIKYGLREEGISEICIETVKQKENITITISDTGGGFPGDEIAAINEETGDENGVYKVGIRNTQQRLRLFYGDAAVIRVGNKPEGGAVVYICFPLKKV